MTLATLPPDKGDPVVETMTVTFPRLSKSGGPAGRIVPGGAGPTRVRHVLDGGLVVRIE